MRVLSCHHFNLCWHLCFSVTARSLLLMQSRRESSVSKRQSRLDRAEDTGKSFGGSLISVPLIQWSLEDILPERVDCHPIRLFCLKLFWCESRRATTQFDRAKDVPDEKPASNFSVSWFASHLPATSAYLPAGGYRADREHHRHKLVNPEPFGSARNR